jgi:hypothetical protein
MFMVPPKNDTEIALQEVIGKTIEEHKAFDEKVAWLKKRWKGEHSLVTEVMSPMIAFDLTPVFYAAIIIDNLEYFKKHYHEKQAYDNLQRACLCGSQKIAEFLLDKLKIDYSSSDPEYDFILGYVAASIAVSVSASGDTTFSGNTTWLKKIATILANAEKKVPGSIYGLGTHDKILDIIDDIFDQNKPTNNRQSVNQNAPETRKLSSPKL